VLRFRDIEGTLEDAAIRLEKERHLDVLETQARVREAEEAKAAEERRERQALAAREAEERYQLRMAEHRALQAEQAQAAAEKRKVLDAELDSCAERMTYPFRLWACVGDTDESTGWEWEQLLCPEGPHEDTFSYLGHAREIDFGVSTLPPGQSCEFSYPETEGGYETITSQEQRLDLAKSVNEVARGGDYPAWLTVDLDAVRWSVFTEWVQAYGEWQNSRPYDCLGGVCLNAWSSDLTPKVVTVARTPMQRTVEVCNNRVAAIYLVAGWVHYQDNFEWVDIAPGAVIDTYTDGTPGSNFRASAEREMAAMGWVYNVLPDSTTSFYKHPHKKGIRMTEFKRSSYGTGWAVTLSSKHPGYSELCQGELREGL
jgi:hypothetical protein